ncbi:multiheme c-type cytochrome [Fodinibius sediminis]|uniref:Cytochrome c554 and c-prime n=1 Tax=Fodinibius sediminis TaxID=1214077 RepID=A0A521BDR0_9BACT|nr:multiheme c-type cytochrome [Fodinibius sediminis]SMO45227.1 Cytochrome c554 and c-prime [Fodinibius sediminis]
MHIRLILLLTLPVVILIIGSSFNRVQSGQSGNGEPATPPYHRLFETSAACMSCHNGLMTPSGEDVSFGTDWRASMMANAARDPYWHAAVRREVTDHPESQAHIEEECSTCHMPMAHYESVQNGEQPQVFANLPVNEAVSRTHLLAADGVSCTTCHQITDDNFGQRESFTGRFGLDTTTAMGNRSVFGPYPVDQGLSRIMHSSSGFEQQQSRHIQRSEMCATCHTLITKSLGPDGEVIGELPEQVPYLEWRHSSFVDQRSCQSCHMPVIQEPVAISSVMGQPREEVSRHTFRGGNFFMLKMLNRYRQDLGVQALPAEMEAAIRRTEEHLQDRTAALEFRRLERNGGQLEADLLITNLAGHKLPTAYPSRRSWVHFTIRDSAGQVLFESGGLEADGAITGNDNDEDPARYEPHYTRITRPGEVQVYESIMAGPRGEVTTGLLTAVTFIKDNRLLPDGFDKSEAGEDIAVRGAAYEDPDFLGGSDQLQYRVDVSGARGPLHVEAALWYQPIAFRWAQNLSGYDTKETNRFVYYYDSMSEQSGIKLTETSTTVQ